MSRARAVCLLAAIFLFGAVSGAAGLGAFLAYRFHRGGFESQRIDRFVTSGLARRLRLDATQKEVLSQVVTRTRDRMQEVRAGLRPRIKQILDRGYAELAPVLRPDQVEELNRIHSEMERRHPVDDAMF